MNFAHLFEAAMLVCFGFSWPLNVVKAYRARTAKGTSLPFIILIITGYVAGITAKIINGQFNYVLAVYFLNLIIVMTNIFVYIRNKALDKKAAVKSIELKITKNEIKEFENTEKPMTNFSYSLDEIINRETQKSEEKDAVILLGGARDISIPVGALSKEFSFNFPIYNKSRSDYSVYTIQNYFQKNLEASEPEAVMIHLGENDISLFEKNPSEFDKYYINFVEYLKNTRKNCRIALLSVENYEGNITVKLMNSHIKSIADAEKVNFISLENAKLWNPEATKAAVDFACNMGLTIRKPLHNVAEILFSYAYHNLVQVNPLPNKTA